ncbi:MAG TPA: nitrate- and nitrite sensing domain-containing protein [Ramlibacter sp.]|nr:nitrate- and nitrite sensing domain-containing protein [Ramlibacter sp.]
MKSGSSFLLAARQCEIAELEQLARMGELVSVIGRFIHALQRERGIANIYLGSQGVRFGQQRVQQIAEGEAVEQEVRAQFEQLDTAAQVRNGSRLFSRVAVVLHELEGLPALRQRVAEHALTAGDATQAYVKLVAGLLAVVFEAADAATDPEISRALIAMLNFMQGKEYAGQERAFGARVFAAGYVDSAGQQQWRHLIDSQQGCFQAFADFSDPEILRADQASREPVVLADIERLRRVGCTVRGGELDPALVNVWYEACTRRIDAMRAVEDQLALQLRRLCETRIADSRAELRDQRALLDELSRQAVAAAAGGTARMGPQLERSMLKMVQEQSRRLQAMSDELDAVRATLNERKVVDRAKGLLMAHRNMSEDEAYKALRQMAMNQNRRLIDVANAVLSLADVLPGGSR